MSQATVKARRREIRRAVGAQALGTIAEHEQQVALLARSLTDLHASLAGLQTDVGVVFYNLTAEEVARKLDVAELRGRLTAFQRRTLWQRLRWLLFGS